MREALDRLAEKNETTHCQDRPVPFADVRQSPEDAKRMCGRGAEDECPVLELCGQLGFTESVYADNMIYGGYTWRKGLPVVSETGYRESRPKRKKGT